MFIERNKFKKFAVYDSFLKSLLKLIFLGSKSSDKAVFNFLSISSSFTVAGDADPFKFSLKSYHLSFGNKEPLVFFKSNDPGLLFF